MQNNPTSRKTVLINAVVFTLMITLGIGGYMFFMGSKPKVAKKAAIKKVAAVTVRHLEKGSVSMQIKGTGVVIPAREVELKPEVSGTIAWTAPQFAAGGIIKKGQVILRIDTRDYDIALRKSKSTLETAKADLMMEEGQQRVAKEGIRLLDESKSAAKYSTALALRKPQLITAKAELEKAKADVELAELNVSRCTLRAPFDVMIQETGANLGSRVTTSSTVATLVGIDEYWVETAVPVDRLENLGLSRNSITAKVVRQGGTSQWAGKVLRLTGTLTESTRLARVIVSIIDPRGLRSQNFSMPLMLGDYVDVIIEGNTIQSAYKIPRDLVHNENEIWVYTDGKLTIRKLKIVWKTPEAVYATDGITESDAIVASNLNNAYSGMALALDSGSAPTVAEQPKEESQKKTINNSDNSARNGNKVATAE
ncbi:efflux RND transporter periplasmic adaptor subunit [Halodesulfovibrio aestuarii]|uniref:RND family efflux transporter, MFP subunit n=1 Tax=Halodesulfovibrio aestuarii TaxID=126333 RepID=A0A8G2F8M6_9BACT|nr:efflux RND transporter periplasmic adaptor subunit [Halodesulfovibrio aestuarii]SHI96884.1 RND family efflux transporter, MFP subunit [Halodesulfovibrio aestuarii]